MKRVSESRSPFVSKWRVCERGYQWRSEGLERADERLVLRTDLRGNQKYETELDQAGFLKERPSADRWLVADEMVKGWDPPSLTLSYDPLAVAGLHRAFGSLDPSEAGIKSFADTYGFLGRSVERLTSTDEERLSAWGEALADWRAEIARMELLLRLWDLYRDAHPDALDELGGHIAIYGVSAVFYWNVLARVEDSETISPYWCDLSELPHATDPLTRRRLAARLLLREAINNELSTGTDAAVDVRDGSPVLLIPKDLRGAMYVHFAQELTGKSVPAIACAACGAYFVPEHGRQRYCDERCKFKGYRQRKKQKGETNNGD